MHMYNFLCSDSLLYFFLFLSTLHSVYTRDCSWNILAENSTSACARNILEENTMWSSILEYSMYMYMFEL